MILHGVLGIEGGSGVIFIIVRCGVPSVAVSISGMHEGWSAKKRGKGQMDQRGA